MLLFLNVAIHALNEHLFIRKFIMIHLYLHDKPLMILGPPNFRLNFKPLMALGSQNFWLNFPFGPEYPSQVQNSRYFIDWKSSRHFLSIANKFNWNIYLASINWNSYLASIIDFHPLHHYWLPNWASYLTSIIDFHPLHPYWLPK